MKSAKRRDRSTRLMEDRHLNCLHADRYCTNPFAQGLAAAQDTHADVIMAFEMLEHFLAATTSTRTDVARSSKMQKEPRAPVSSVVAT